LTRAKDKEWLQQVMTEFESPLIRYAARITGDRQRGREVVQETFLSLWQQKRSEIAHRVAPWLFHVCRNKALDTRKKENPMISVGLESQLGVADGPSAVDRLEQKESTNQLLGKLAQLPDHQQEVIRLKFQNNLSYKEIADVTGHSVSYVGVLIHDGIKSLRLSMKGVK
jgi:RNA polymerase sigma-70 factor (ECF subfamily)